MKRVSRDFITVFAIALVVVALSLGLLPVQDSTHGWLWRSANLLRPRGPADGEPSLLAPFGVAKAAFQASLLTIKLVGSATVLLLSIAIPLGIQSALRPESRAVQALRRATDAISSMPVLLWSTVIFVVVARVFHYDARGNHNAAFAVLSLILGDRLLADLVQRVENGTAEILSQPYLRTVRAGGFNVRRHLLQALAPSVAAAVLSRAMFLISGAIIVELIFDLRGLGTLVLASLKRGQPDPHIAFGASVALVCIGLAFRLAHDGLVLAADGRVRR